MDELSGLVHTDPAQVNFTSDNDTYRLFWGKTTDRYYTAGNQLMLRFASPQALPAGGQTADETRPGLRYAYGFRVGQKLFTPADLSLTPAELRPLDRPYAGWLYAGVFKETFWAEGEEGRHLRLGMDIGCLGPCALGDQTQHFAHEIVNGDDAEGWGSQIRNGLGVQLNAGYTPRRFMPLSGLEVSPFISAEAGNVFANASGGVSVRIGHFLSPFQAATEYEELVPSLPMAGSLAASSHDEVFVFARLRGRAVAYDATLQGGWFTSSPHTVDPERLQAESEWGAAYKGRTWAISYSLTVQSTQVKGQPFSWTWHRWGRIQFAYMFE